MLDPPAPVCPILLRKPLVSRNDLRVRRVADGVGRNLEAHGGRLAGLIAHFSIAKELQAASFRMVGIGLLQPGTARSQGTVGVKFDPAHPQAICVHPVGRSRPSNRLERRQGACIGHDADAEAARLAGAIHRFPAARVGAHVGHGGQAEAEHDLLRFLERCVGFRRSRCGNPSGSIRFIALSTNRPFSIRPPAGDGVDAVTPASFIAALLATRAWPSTRVEEDRPVATTASRSAALGKFFAGHNSCFQPRPTIQRACGLAAAYAPADPGVRRARTCLSGRAVMRCKPSAHEMAVGVDHAGHYRLGRGRPRRR